MWTYDPTNLDTSELYQVRLEIQDVDSDNQLLQDEEIERMISVETNFWGASARCCEVIARRFAMKADVRLGRSLMVQYTTMAKQYGDMAKALRTKALGAVTPYVGGAKVADKQAFQQDQTLVQPMFARDMQESPWAGRQSPDVGTDTRDSGTSDGG